MALVIHDAEAILHGFSSHGRCGATRIPRGSRKPLLVLSRSAIYRCVMLITAGFFQAVSLAVACRTAKMLSPVDRVAARLKRLDAREKAYMSEHSTTAANCKTCLEDAVDRFWMVGEILWECSKALRDTWEQSERKANDAIEAAWHAENAAKAVQHPRPTGSPRLKGKKS